MSHFLSEYGIFLAKIITSLVVMLILIGFVASITSKGKRKEKLIIRNLKEKYKNMRDILNREILSKKDFKQLVKERKKQKKAQKKVIEKEVKKRIFVLNFKGDIRASEVETLREEITALLKVVTMKDEIVVCIESVGGMIQSYGLAASQLQRIRDRQIPLIAIIDKTAASGGYLMACVADQVFAAPFAIIGSIGVVAQLPNFNRLLKKHDIEFEQITAGEYKRTLSLFGENTNKGRKKMQEEVEEAHKLFKQFIAVHRPSINIEKLATGEYWYGSRAVELGLIDKLITSDDYLLKASEYANLYEISYVIPKKRWSKLSSTISSTISSLL